MQEQFLVLSWSTKILEGSQVINLCKTLIQGIWHL